MPKEERPSKRAATPRPDPPADETAVEVIIKVNRPDYVPRGVQVRAQISPVLFTSVVPGSRLKKLEADPEVHSISVGERLRTIG
jgi:hypothetical protein